MRDRIEKALALSQARATMHANEMGEAHLEARIKSFRLSSPSASSPPRFGFGAARGKIMEDWLLKGAIETDEKIAMDLAEFPQCQDHSQ